MFARSGLLTKNFRLISSIGPRVIVPPPGTICWPIPKGGTKEVPEDCSELVMGKRDEINFPRPVRPIYPGRVRLGFIPEEWFQFFYEKTGATGPYVFGIGVGLTLCSKEFYVMEHEFYAGISLAILGYLAVTKVGPIIAAYLDAEIEKIETTYKSSNENALRVFTDAIEKEKKEQYYAEGQPLILEVKKENINLQLEAIYRQRLLTAYKEVKSRLDFQVDKRDIDRRINQKHMVDWILTKVSESITPEQESRNIDKCIDDLAALAELYNPPAENVEEAAAARAAKQS